MKLTVLTALLFSAMVNAEGTGSSNTNLDATVRKIINEELLKFVETMSSSLKTGSGGKDGPVGGSGPDDAGGITNTSEPKGNGQGDKTTANRGGRTTSGMSATMTNSTKTSTMTDEGKSNAKSKHISVTTSKKTTTTKNSTGGYPTH
jgi:hypothetical protein